jgi:hypothetical protein
MRRLYWIGFATVFALSPAAGAVALAEPVQMTEAQYRLYFDYLGALTDPRVVKLAEAKRLPAIAHNFKVTPAVLKVAVEKGQQYGPEIANIGKVCEEAIREGVKGTPLEDRLVAVQLDVSDAHAVAYVTWTADKPEMIDQEASFLAARVKKVAPIWADLKLVALDPRDKAVKRFDGLITGDAALNIRENRIADFATTRYIKLFEKPRTPPPVDLDAGTPGAGVQVDGGAPAAVSGGLAGRPIDAGAVSPR